MLDKGRLRKADIFSGGIIFILGLVIVSGALKMPMKDTYGGVQNVWYVSPAIFPLFIGTIISMLGLGLFIYALKTVGKTKLLETFEFLASSEMVLFLKDPGTVRFYAIVTVFTSFIFLMIPRIDFFLSAILFLTAFISMFYFDDDRLLRKILFCFLVISVIVFLFFLLKLDTKLSSFLPYCADWLVMTLTVSLMILVKIFVKNRPDLKKKYRTCIILAILVPFLIGIIFKYLLLVPMPFEGAVVELLDAIWYYEY